MSRALLANNASTTTTAAITSTAATTFAITAATNFPTPAAGQYFYGTLLDSALIPEIVKVTGISGLTVTCVRAQDGTAARTFLNGASFKLNLTGAVMAELAALAEPQTYSAAQRGAILPVTYSATVTLDLDTSNNFAIGALTGSLTLANPTHITPGQSGSIFLPQDATGSRTIAYGSYWKFESGVAPTASTAASAEDRLDYIVKTSTYIEARLAKAHA